jgi:hypothetical protein
MELGMDLSVLTEAIDELTGADPATFADGPSIEGLHRQLARLEAFTAAASASFEASEDWALDGALTASAWVSTRCRLPRAQARKVMRRGRVLGDLPHFGAAWAAGEITAHHLDAVLSVRSAATEEALGRDEALLLDQARTLPFEPFTRALAYWEQLADPDGTEASAEESRNRRDVYLAESFAGVWLGKMTLDPISGAIVADELTRIEQDLFEADWAEAKATLGREPTPTDLPRTPSQRRADALVEMATRSKSTPAGGRRPVPLFTVLVDYPTLAGRVCELARSLVITPGSLVPWLDEAIVERAVFTPPGRVEVGMKSRLFMGATRRAIEIRDRDCTHPYCDGSRHHLEVDHIVPYAQGGLTTQDNGRILCADHNRQRNQRPPPPPSAA